MIGEIATAAPRNDKRVLARTGEIATAAPRNDKRVFAMIGEIATAAPRNERSSWERLGVRFVRGTAGRFQNERGERRDE